MYHCKQYYNYRNGANYLDYECFKVGGINVDLATLYIDHYYVIMSTSGLGSLEKRWMKQLLLHLWELAKILRDLISYRAGPNKQYNHVPLL